MRRISLFFIAFFVGLAISTSAFAQIAKIINVEGSVKVKKDAESSWQKAKPDTYLDDEAQIKTGSNSQCTLSFDEDLTNILTIKDNSHIRMEDVKKGKVFLPKGRVFSLIEDISKLEDFQIRTPTAVAGVKGTGESVQVTKFGTSVMCFEGEAYVAGIDKDGNIGPIRDILAGFGVDVTRDGIIVDIFKLVDRDWKDWEDFRGEVKNTILERVREKKPDQPKKKDLGDPTRPEPEGFAPGDEPIFDPTQRPKLELPDKPDLEPEFDRPDDFDFIDRPSDFEPIDQSDEFSPGDRLDDFGPSKDPDSDTFFKDPTDNFGSMDDPDNRFKRLRDRDDFDPWRDSDGNYRPPK